MSKFKKIMIGILCVLILIPLIVVGYAYMKLNSIHEDTNYKSKVEEVGGITNILLTGIDARPGETASRTDSMMILTIDNKNKSVKLTSLARDTYVQLPGKHKSKLNTAYFWGKEPMLFETIENEFGIDIDKIVQVDFNALMSIIDILGGVEVNITDSSFAVINSHARDCYNMYNSTTKEEFKEVPGPGKQLLNGYQALGFSRIRKIDTAIARDERQQEVLMAIADKVKELPASKYPKLLNSVLPYIKTNIQSSEILKLGVTALNIINSSDDIKKAEFPIIDDVHVKGGIYKKAGWVWLYDVNSTVVLQDFIYKDINMEDNPYLKDYSKIQLNY